MLGDPVLTGTANLVKGWAAVLGGWGLAGDCSNGATFFMSQPGYWWCMETMSSFWHTDFPGVPSRVNQIANAPYCDQACSLDVILHRHIDFKTSNSCPCLTHQEYYDWLHRGRFFCTMLTPTMCICIHVEVMIWRQWADVLAWGRLFAGKQLAALHVSPLCISRVAGGFS